MLRCMNLPLGAQVRDVREAMGIVLAARAWKGAP